MKTLVFNVESLVNNDKTIREATRLFARAGVQVVSAEVSPQTMRKAGVQYRTVSFTMADGQTVTLAVKMTGDVFEVRINNGVVPLRQQDDHAKAISEIAMLLDKKRAAFQKALARVKAPLPPSLRTSRTSVIQAKTEKRDGLAELVAAAESELAELTGEAASA